MSTYWGLNSASRLNSALTDALNEYNQRTDANRTLRDQLKRYGSDHESSPVVIELKRTIERAHWDKKEQAIVDQVRGHAEQVFGKERVGKEEVTTITTGWLEFAEKRVLAEKLKQVFTGASAPRCSHIVDALKIYGRDKDGNILFPMQVARSKGHLAGVLDVLSQSIGENGCPPCILSVQRSNNGRQLLDLIGTNLSPEERGRVMKMCRVQDGEGDTMLMKLAKQSDLPQAVSTLVSMGIERKMVRELLSIPNNQGATPLSIADTLNQTRLVERNLSSEQSRLIPDFYAHLRRDSIGPASTTLGHYDNRDQVIAHLCTPDTVGRLSLMQVAEDRLLPRALEAVLTGATKEQAQQVFVGLKAEYYGSSALSIAQGHRQGPEALMRIAENKFLPQALDVLLEGATKEQARQVFGSLKTERQGSSALGIARSYRQGSEIVEVFAKHGFPLKVKPKKKTDAHAVPETGAHVERGGAQGPVQGLEGNG